MAAYGMPFHMAATLALAVAIAGVCTLAAKAPAGASAPPTPVRYYDPLPR